MSHATEVLAERMEQKLSLLMQLRDLGRRQSVLIDAGDLTQLLKLLSAKQRLLSALHTIERALDPFRSEDPEARIWASSAQRSRCAQAATECERLLRAIVEQERESETQMTLRRDEAAARLNGAHSTAEVRHAYVSQRLNTSSQLDLTQG
jgi:hypothetical protein